MPDDDAFPQRRSEAAAIDGVVARKPRHDAAVPRAPDAALGSHRFAFGTPGPDRPGGRHLYSATVSHVTRRGAYAVFHAALAFSEADFRDGLRLVLGSEAEELADVGFGILWNPISRSLVTDDVRAFLQRAEAISDPTGSAQIHVWLEQRLC